MAVMICAYCQIPLARGASKSSPSKALSSIESFEQGVPEIVLTGIHLGDYGRDLSEQELSWCKDAKQPLNFKKTFQILNLKG